MVLQALEAGEVEEAVYNRMERPVFEKHPQLAVWKERLLEHACTAAAMSGSGPTLFGLCEDGKHAQRVAESFDEIPTAIVRSVPHGVRREPA